jgi:hypothetical protein
MLIPVKKLCVLVIVGFVLSLTPAAHAQFGALQKFLFNGAEYLGNPNYYNQPQGGPLYDFNTYDQRLQWNRIGNGYAWESYRFFGPDSYGNENTVDLGAFTMQLGPNQNFIGGNQPVGIHSRVGYNTRIIPEAFFDLQTGTRTFNQFSGITNFASAPINYTVTLNTGVQDFTWTGDALVDAHGTINALGFYDTDIRFTNVGNYTADGVLLHDEQVTDFDIGPINASGNIAFDMLGSLLQAGGATAEAVPPRLLSGAAGRERIDDIVARLKAGEAISEDDAKYLAQEMFTSAFQADPLGVLQNGFPNEIPGFEGVSLSMLSTPSDADGGTTTPEPGTLLLVAASASGALWAGRFGRRGLALRGRS